MHARHKNAAARRICFILFTFSLRFRFVLFHDKLRSPGRFMWLVASWGWSSSWSSGLFTGQLWAMGHWITLALCDCQSNVSLCLLVDIWVAAHTLVTTLVTIHWTRWKAALLTGDKRSSSRQHKWHDTTRHKKKRKEQLFVLQMNLSSCQYASEKVSHKLIILTRMDAESPLTSLLEKKQTIARKKERERERESPLCPWQMLL